MAELPGFFVPAATPENQETVYSELAEMCNREPLAERERIYSISFMHDGVEWIATVGERLRGRRITSRRHGGRVPESVQVLSDPATVLAIFSGRPYMVATDARLRRGVVSAWENPFMAGVPNTIRHFRSECPKD